MGLARMLGVWPSIVAWPFSSSTLFLCFETPEEFEYVNRLRDRESTTALIAVRHHSVASSSSRRRSCRVIGVLGLFV